jgi:CRISPR-associated exonuclease Cas4
MSTFSITPSHIIEHLFCPRFTYFQFVLRVPQFEEKNYKVMKGRQMHDNKLEQNKEYLRKRIGVKSKLLNQYLTNTMLRGEVDEVLFLEDGTAAPLDYKFAQYNEIVYSTYQTQLFCYALLIEQNFHIEVNRGYLVYIRSSNKLVEVKIEKDDKLEIVKNCNEIAEIIQKNIYPRSTKYKQRCVDCTYKKICVK